MGKIVEAAKKAGEPAAAPFQVSFPDGTARTFETEAAAEGALEGFEIKVRRGGIFVTKAIPKPARKSKPKADTE